MKLAICCTLRKSILSLQIISNFPSCGLRLIPILAYVDIKTCCFTAEFEFCILLLFLRAASQLQQNCTSGYDVFFTWKLIINFWTVFLTRTS